MPMTRLILIAALLLAVLAARPAGVTHAAGNADAAHACQQTGYLTLFRADGTGFKNAGECTSYAAHGGQFSSGIAACAVGSNSGCVTLTNVTLDGINGFTGSYTLTGLYDFSPTQTNC